MEKAIRRQIESYKKLVKSFEDDMEKENAITVKNMTAAQIIVLRYVIRDLENVLTLFGK